MADRDKESQYDRKIKDTFIGLLIATGTEKQFNRLNKTKDPIVRYTLFLEFLRIIMDMGISLASATIEEEITEQENEVAMMQGEVLPREQLKKAKVSERLHKTQHMIEKLKTELETYFDGFTDWIAQPAYSPDHPFGSKMMKDAENDHAEKKAELSEKKESDLVISSS